MKQPPLNKINKLTKDVVEPMIVGIRSSYFTEILKLVSDNKFIDETVCVKTFVKVMKNITDGDEERMTKVFKRYLEQNRDK